MLVVKNLPSIAGDTKDLDLTSGSWRSPREGYGNPLQTLAWRIPWTEKPGGLQSMESQRVGHDWSDLACTNIIKGGLIPHLPLNIVFHFILLCFLWSKRLTSNSFFFFFSFPDKSNHHIFSELQKLLCLCDELVCFPLFMRLESGCESWENLFWIFKRFSMSHQKTHPCRTTMYALQLLSSKKSVYCWLKERLWLPGCVHSPRTLRGFQFWVLGVVFQIKCFYPEGPVLVGAALVSLPPTLIDLWFWSS